MTVRSETYLLSRWTEFETVLAHDETGAYGQRQAQLTRRHPGSILQGHEFRPDKSFFAVDESEDCQFLSTKHRHIGLGEPETSIATINAFPKMTILIEPCDHGLGKGRRLVCIRNCWGLRREKIVTVRERPGQAEGSGGSGTITLAPDEANPAGTFVRSIERVKRTSEKLLELRLGRYRRHQTLLQSINRLAMVNPPPSLKDCANSSLSTAYRRDDSLVAGPTRFLPPRA